jgi:hypothetical protein
LKPQDVEEFFKRVDGKIEFSIRVILTGGAAGILQGVQRATQDIDFELIIQSKNKKRDWNVIETIFKEVAAATHIIPQYAEDIDRWSAIALPVKRSWLFKKFKHVEIRVLDADLWAIGKLTRFLRSDVDDIRTVLKTSGGNPEKVVKVWGLALKNSPKSSSLFLFRKQVEQFIDRYASEIWGKNVDAEKLKKLFLKTSLS